MRLYENIIIGNFLYALGFAIRARLTTGSIPSVINLLQQTPADTLLGDMLLGFPGVIRLIEFKTEDNRSKKELARHTTLLNSVQTRPEFEEVSRRVHWYIETAPSEKLAVIARIVPYLDAFPVGKKRDRLETFIEALATEVVNGQSADTAAQEVNYLKWVKLMQGDGKIGSGGLLLVANADGTLHYAQLLDMLELRLKHKLWIELHKQRLQRELTYQRTLEQEQYPKLKRQGPTR